MRKLDEWPRGLRQRFTKPPFCKKNREFESHLIRPYKMTQQSLFCWVDVSKVSAYFACEIRKTFRSLVLTRAKSTWLCNSRKMYSWSHLIRKYKINVIIYIINNKQYNFMLKEFKQFLLRGNVVDLAVGVVIGAAFGTIVTALVTDLLTPFISAIAKTPDFSNLVFTINGSTFKYGHFINSFLSFILVAFSIFFFVVKPMNILISHSRSKKELPADPTTKKCSECLSEVPIEAKRCSHCAQIIS